MSPIGKQPSLFASLEKAFREEHKSKFMFYTKAESAAAWDKCVADAGRR